MPQNRHALPAIFLAAGTALFGAGFATVLVENSPFLPWVSSVLIGSGMALMVAALFWEIGLQIHSWSASRKLLIVSSSPNHTYTQKDGSIILAMHLEITNPSHQSRSINNVRLQADPDDVIISLAAVDWTDPGKAQIVIQEKEQEIRHMVPSDDVLKFPLFVGGENRIGGLIFLYLRPKPSLWTVALTISLLDNHRELGAVTVTLNARTMG